MKLFFKLFKLSILPLVIMIGIPFFIKGPDNKPLLTWDKLTGPDITLPKLPELPNLKNIQEKIDKKVSSVFSSSNGKKMKVYKWKDKKGVWHFSDKENPNGASETIYVESIVDTVRFDPKVESEEREKSKISPKTSKGPMKRLSPVSPYTQIPELFEQARDVKGQIERRYVEQGKILNDR